MGLRWHALVCIITTVLLEQTHGGIIKKIISHKRDIPPPKEENISLPFGTQPINFNHVYNINVPLGSLCSVDLETPDGIARPKADSSEQHIEHTTDGENQIVFTHRINIPRQACGCAAGPDIRDLLNRLEALEGHVSSLRQQCANGGCCENGAQQGKGRVDVKPFCGAHGNYSAHGCGCLCNPGWKGENCSEPECPANCNNRGTCIDGKCVCDTGFTGDDCGIGDSCPSDCSDQGRCINGVCYCFEGYAGEDCSQELCPNNCSGQGTCVDGKCVCDEGLTGEDCKDLACLNNCYNRGRCVDGECVCDEGFADVDCSEIICPKDCYDRGRCIEGVCYCDEGFTGEDCGELVCLNNCNNHGVCVDGECICHEGFTGEDCGELACPNNCHDRGRCVSGHCICDEGFAGEDCGQLSCPNDCSNHGLCVNGQCVCDHGFTGEDCSELSCPNDCNNRGRCVSGQCICEEGYKGEDCAELTCPNECYDRGRCVNGRCVCDEGFAGKDCEQLSCPNDCSNHGICVNGQCVCDHGFTGEDCSELVCPNDCNNRGRCVNGQCVCDSGYRGVDCGELACPNNCNDRGRCVDGQCICNEGYTNEDCSAVSPPKNLKVTEVTPQTVDVEWQNEVRVNEYLVTYVPTSPGGLQMEIRVPGDQLSSTIQELEPGIEYLINVYAILNNERSIPVSARVATYLPTPDGLRFKSIRETSVEVEWDPIEIGFDGWEILFKAPKEDNGEILNSLKRSEVSFVQTGLAPGEEYEVSLHVVKNNTRGPAAKRKLTTMIDAPSQVEVNKVTDTTAHITWRNPAARIEGISLFYGTIGGEKAVVDLPDIETTYSIAELQPDTEYEVSLVSKRGDMRSVPATNTFTTDLDPPRNLRNVSQTEDSITLQWRNSRSGVTEYKVKFSPLAGGEHMETTVRRSSQQATTIKIPDLLPGTEYGFGVSAIKDNRESAPATINVATDLDSPKDLRVTKTTENSITVEWERPLAVIDRYYIIYISSSGERNEEVVSADAVSHILSGLQPAAEYTIILIAQRGKLKSSASTTSASTGLEPLRGLKFSKVSPRSALVTWEAPLAPVDMFVVNYNPKTHGKTQQVIVKGDQKAVELTDLKPGTEYVVTLMALRGSARTEPLVGSVTTVIPEEDFTPPPYGSTPIPDSVFFEAPETVFSGTGDGQISNLTVSKVTTDGIQLSWITETASYDNFIIKYRSALGASDVTEISTPGDVLTFELKGLMPSTPYEITLQGVAGGQHSEPLNILATTADLINAVDGQINQTTVRTWLHKDGGFNSEPTVSSVKGVLYSRLGSLTVINTTSESIKLSWTLQNGSFDAFLIVATDYTGLHGPLEMSLYGDVRNTEVTGLLDSTQYKVYLYGFVGNWRSDPLNAEATTEPLDNSTAHSPSTDIAKPGNLEVTNVTSTSFQLSWAAHAGAFDSFLLTVQDVKGLGRPLRISYLPDQHTADIQGLVPGTDYKIDLYGVVQGHLSHPLTEIARTDSKIDNLTVSDVTSGSFRLSWTAEGPYENFVVGIKDSDGLHQPQEYTLSGDQRSLDIPDLPAVTDYEISVYGVINGQRTKPLYTEAHTASKPEISNLMITNLTSDGFTVSWTANGTFESFVVDVTDPNRIFETSEYNVSGNLRSIGITKLSASTDYVIYLTGLSQGQHMHTFSAIATTEAEPEVSNLVVSDITANSFSLSWTGKDEAFESFVIELIDSDRFSEPLEYAVPGNMRSTELSDLIAGTNYVVYLYGIANGRRTNPVTAVALTEEEPELDNLVVSDITSEGFTLSWTAEDGAFEYFIIDVKDSESSLDPIQHVLSGRTRTTDISGLVEGTGYQINITGVTEGWHTQPLTAVTATEEKPKMENPVVSNINSYGFKVSWNATDGAYESYIIVVRDSGRLLEPMEHRVSGNQRSITITGLITGIGYDINIYGVAKGQHSKPLFTRTATEAEPEVDHLTVSGVTSNGFKLSWTTDDKPFDYFNIRVRDSKNELPLLEYTLSGDLRTTDIQGLQDGTEYDISLVGVIDGRQSQPINTIAITEAEPEVDHLTVSGVTSNGFKLSWTTDDKPFDYFNIRVRDSKNELPPLEYTLSGDLRTTDIQGLQDGTEYDISLVGVTDGRQSQPINTIAITEAEPEVDHLTVSGATSNGFKLSWTTDDNRFDSFNIRVRDSKNEFPPLTYTLSGDLRTTDIQGLQDGTEYDISLVGVTDGRQSQPINTIAITEAEPEVDHLTVSGATSNGFKLSWTTDDNRFDSFNIRVRDSKNEFPPLTYTLSGDLRTTDIQGLQDGTEYDISLVGVTDGRQSQPINTIAITGLESPKHLEFSEVTDTTVLVRWDLPRAQVDRFKVIYEPTDGGESTTVIVEGSRSQTVLRNLIPATQYKIRVVSVKGFEESEPTSGGVRTALDSPSDLRVLNTTESEALLVWKPSIAAVDEYVITYTADNGSPVMKRVAGNLIQSELTHLLPGTHYSVMIYAMKDSLRSSTSDISFTTAIDSPRDLRVSDVTVNDALISWKPPQVQISGYILTIEDEDGKIQKVEYFGATVRSYSLMQLEPSTRYNVKLQAYTSSERSSVIETSFKTVGLLYPFPEDCSQSLLNGETSTGLQTIFVNGNRSQPLQVYCDMTTDGGGWMVFQRRQNGEVDFFRKWKEYAAGFGNPSGEFWLGLENLHKITSEGRYELRVDLRDQGDTAYAIYDKFSISDAKSRYKLHIGGYRGTAGDSLSYHQGRPFSTRDRDNDVAVTNCALSYKGAWWYKNCHKVNLNGKYGVENHSQGINWFDWKGHEHSIEFAEMKLRPYTFRGLERKKRAQQKH